MIPRQSPFHLAALDYWRNGYSPIPLPLGAKHPPPESFTGGNATPVTEQQILEWLNDPTPRNIGLVMPDDVVILDVDGAEAEQRLINYLGSIPRTWRTTRGDPYRYHLWLQTPNNRTWPGKLVSGVDVISKHYRYIVVPPSVHPSGALYRFVDPRGKMAWYIPPSEELNIVSSKVLRATRRGSYVPYERASVDSRLWITEHGKGKPCPEIRRVLVRHQRLIRQHAAMGGMHDAMTNGVWAILAEVSAGHLGGYAVMEKLKRTFFEQAEQSGRRVTKEIKSEWARACIGAIEKTAMERVRVGDPCVIEESERGKDPGRFFDPKHGLKADTLQRAVEKTGKLAVGPGKIIYRHIDGLWVPDGESEIYRRCEKLLQERKRPSHAANVKTFIEHQEPLITDDKQDTQYLNLPNGLLDWKEGKLYPHNANIISTARIPVEWNEDAECPAIDRWLGEVFPADATDLALEILGYMLYNDNPLHKAIMLKGDGRNGKGTYLRLARMLVGHNNVSAITPQALDSDRFAAGQLHGKLANLVGDVDPRIFKSTEQFKQLTGGDYINAQHKFGQPFTFRCRALMIAAFNALPRTADTTEGFFSRWVVIPFPNSFPNPDIHLALRLARELPGLLVKAVLGLQRVLQRRAFDIPPSVRAATGKFRLEADPMRSFIEERIVSLHPNRVELIPRQEVYLEYAQWSAVNGFQTMSAQRFYEQFQMSCVGVLEFPLYPIKRADTRYYRGIDLKK